MTATHLFLICLAVALVGALFVIQCVRSYLRLFQARFALWNILNDTWQREQDIYYALHHKGIGLSCPQFRKFMANLVNCDKIEKKSDPSTSFGPEYRHQIWYRLAQHRKARGATHSATLYS